MSKKIEYPSGLITRKEADRIKAKNPGRIPVIITRMSSDLTMKNTKFLVPCDLTLGQMQYVFRKSMKLDPSKAIFIYINNSIIPQTSALVSDLYSQHETDGFLKVSVLTENTFG